MVECELISTSFLICLICVLIDTWWNVNLCGLLNIPAALTVLIDTWWNVNLYIPEKLPCQTDVLIDTWWNVN